MPKNEVEEYAAGIKGTDNAEHARKSLEDAGLTEYEVAVARSNELMLDYDSPDVPSTFYSGLSFLDQRFGGKIIDAAVYKSRSGNRHVVVKLPEAISDEERIAWQAVLGSDQKREALSLISCGRDVKNPVLLFMRKDRKKHKSSTKIKFVQ